MGQYGCNGEGKPRAAQISRRMWVTCRIRRAPVPRFLGRRAAVFIEDELRLQLCSVVFPLVQNSCRLSVGSKRQPRAVEHSGRCTLVGMTLKVKLPSCCCFHRRRIASAVVFRRLLELHSIERFRWLGHWPLRHKNAHPSPGVGFEYGIDSQRIRGNAGRSSSIGSAAADDERTEENARSEDLGVETIATVTHLFCRAVT